MRKLLAILPQGVAWFFLVAFCGGAAKACCYRKPGARWPDVAAQAFASGFTGFIVGTALLRWTGEDHMDLILSLVGLAGWIGPTLMDYLASTALRLLKSRLDAATKDNNGDGDGSLPLQ